MCAGVADQLADGCRTSVDGGHQIRLKRCEKFLYGFKADRYAARSRRPAGLGRRPTADASASRRRRRFQPGGRHETQRSLGHLMSGRYPRLYYCRKRLER